MGAGVVGLGGWRVRWVAVAVTAALGFTAAASPVSAGDDATGATGAAAAVQQWPSAATESAAPGEPVEEVMVDFVPEPVTWPASGAAQVQVPGSGAARVAATVVSVGAPGLTRAETRRTLPGPGTDRGAATSPAPVADAPDEVKVQVHDRAVADQVGGVGVALTLTIPGGTDQSDSAAVATGEQDTASATAPVPEADGAAATAAPAGETSAEAGDDAAVVTSDPGATLEPSAPEATVVAPGTQEPGQGEGLAVSVVVDASGFAGAFGGDFLGRARLAVVPACVLEAVGAGEVPGRDCEAERVVLPTVIDRDAATLSAQVPVSGEGSTMVALTSSASGSSGTYAATPVNVSGSWDVGLGSGAFVWSYPLPVAPAVVGSVPGLELSYSSSTVDGMTAGDNAQASQQGIGWGITEAFVEQLYASCGVVSWDSGSKDLCYEGDHYRIVLNGKSSVLVEDEDAPGTSSGVRVFRLRDDPGWRVELRRSSSASNPDHEGEFWRVYTEDGTRYDFGRGYASTTDRLTSSVWTVPVFGDDPGDPCYSSVLANGWCEQAWRWNLDLVYDTNENGAFYFYTPETNKYQRMRTTDAVYTRGGHLNKIEYSSQNSAAGFSAPTSMVDLSWNYRCTAAVTGWPAGATNTCPALSKANASSYPDVPADLLCTSACTEDGPTFFSGRMLTSVTSSRLNGTTWARIDKVAFGYQFPAHADGTDPHLWLARVERSGVGTDGSTTTLPLLELGGTQLDNRVDHDTAGGVAPLKKYRVVRVSDELGGITRITYGHPSGQSCTGNQPSQFDRNTRDCFPRYWTPEFGPAGFGLFHKYVTLQVVHEDVPMGGTGTQGTTAGTPKETTTYTYRGGGGWAQDNQPTGIVPLTAQSYADWRGYGEVEVRELGDATYRGTTTPAVLSMTQYRLHRGLHGKKFSDGTTLTETVDGFVSGSSTDYPYLAGRTREQRLLRVYPDSEWGGTVTTYTRARTELAGTSTDLSKDSALVVPSTVTTRVTEDPRDGTAFTTQYARQVYEYDEHGRQTSLSRQSDAPDMCTRTVYAGDAGDEQVNLLTFPARVQQFTKACTATDGVQVAATRYYYDDNDPAGVLIGQPLGDGNLTLTRTFFKLGQYADELTSYDSNGRIVTATDGNGNTTTVSYPNPITDAVQIVSTTDAKGHTSTTTSDARRMLPVRLVDANGSTTTTGYDGLGRLSWVQRPGDTTTSPSATFSYTLDPDRATPAKVSTTTRQPGGGTQTSWIFLDSQGRQRQVQAPAADGTARTTITSTRYDERGLLEATSYPYPAAVAPGAALQQLALTSSALQETRNTYNRRQTLTRQAHYSAGTQQWATTITDTGLRTITNAPGSGVDSTVTVDVLGRVTTRTEGTGSTTATTSYSYDVLGALTRSVDPTGHASNHTYDWAGRRTASTDPDAGTTTYVHDDNGNITTTTTATGQVTTTGYDTLDRPTQVKAAATAVATPQVLAEYAYDTAPKGIGRPATSTYRTPDGLTFTSTVTGYTTRGLPTGTSTALPAIAGQPATTYTTGLTYGPADEPATTTLPAVGPLPAETLTHGYDTTSGLPTTLTGATGYVTATGYTYDGTTSTRTTGSTTRGLKTTYTLDPATRRLSTVATHQLTNNAATPVLEDDYTFDDAGNLTRVVDTLPATDVATCHTYDPLGRLTHSWTTTATACTDTDTATAGTAGYNTRWAYNPAGDITAITRGATTTNHTYTTTGHPHALTTAGTTSYDYDAAGRLTSATSGSDTTTYQWALNGTLDTVTTAEGTTRTIHAPDGTRLARTTPDGTTTLYLGDTELDLRNGTVLTARRYYTHNGHTIAIRTPDGLTFQTTDRQGSAQLQLTPGQTTPHRIRTDPYGAPRTGSPTPLTDRYWLGKTTDPTTGLTHLGHRYYDPTTARFITPDPLANHTTTQAPNPYLYGNANPNTYTDPSGLCSVGTGAYNPDTPGGCQTAPGTTRNGGARSAPYGVGQQPKHVREVLNVNFRVDHERAKIESWIRINNWNRSPSARPLAQRAQDLAYELTLRDFVDCGTKGSGTACLFAAISIVPGGKGGTLAIKGVMKTGRHLKNAGSAAKTITQVGGHSIDDLSRAAAVVDRNGLSGAGRVLQKHGDRARSSFPKSTGTAAERNAQGQVVVDDILTDPWGTSEVLDNVMDVWDSSGRGVRFRTDGTFMGFLEPR